MAGPPQFPPPPSGPPPPYGTPPYGTPAPWSPPPSWAQPGGYSPPGYGPPSTDPFAIVSLVAACIGVFVCFVGPIVAIVFGHIARSRIKRTGAGGRGLALAGLIIGYLEIVFATVGIIILVVVSVSSNNNAQLAGRALASQIQAVSAQTGGSPRSVDVVRQAIGRAGLHPDKVYVGSTDVYAVDATDAEIADQDWRLEVHEGTFGQSCVYIPADRSGFTGVHSGSCPTLFGSTGSPFG
jgi:hypothetical protein